MVWLPGAYQTAQDFLTARQSRQRTTEVGRNPALEESEEPVTRRAGDAVIDGGNEDGVNGGLREVRRSPLLGLANVDLVVERKYDVFEDHIVTAAGAQAQMIPGLDDPRTWQPGWNQKQSHARLRLIRRRPDRIPFQDRRPGRIDLATA